MLFSLALLLSGHNEPGGGFIGGLVAAVAYTLYALALDVRSARSILKAEPHIFTSAGLLVALLSGLVSVFAGQPFMTRRWTTIYLGTSYEIPLGTPMLFDVGVYLVVLGVALTIVFAMLEEEEP